MSQYFTLPNGFKIPVLGYGCASRTPDFNEALDIALEAGYRHLDTAFVYKSEAAIGTVLKKWIPTKLKREDIFITSKFMPDGSQENNVEDKIKKSLEDLQLEYVDLYLIHRPSSDDDENIKIWKQLEAQVDAGRTKYIGLSNFNIQQIEKILEIARIKPVNLQVQLHLYGQRKELVNFCKKNDITVVAWSPLGAPGRNHKQPLNIIDNEVLKKVATKYGKSPAQISLKFLIQEGIVPIPKSLNKGRIQENFNIFDFKLSEDDISVLRNVDQNLFTTM